LDRNAGESLSYAEYPDAQYVSPPIEGILKEHEHGYKDNLMRYWLRVVVEVR
jgi:hypothetical protein